MKDSNELAYADGYKKHCYLILVGFIVDYEKQIFIIGIQTNMQCSISYF